MPSNMFDELGLSASATEITTDKFEQQIDSDDGTQRLFAIISLRRFPGAKHTLRFYCQRSGLDESELSAKEFAQALATWTTIHAQIVKRYGVETPPLEAT